VKNYREYGSLLNVRFYKNDLERWKEIDEAKRKVAEHLQIPQGSCILDILVGESDFSRATARASEGSLIVAGEILDSDLKEAKHRVERDGLKKRIELLRMDITRMAFRKDSFDYVVNFTGWEDFTAISGEELVDAVFRDIARVLRPNGILALTFIPPLDLGDAISRKDDELHEYTYKSNKKPKYFNSQFFLRMFKKYGLKTIGQGIFETPKNRIQPEDARNYIKWICQNYRSFYAPDVEMRSYEEVIREFGRFIDEYGMRERRSEFILLIGQNVVEKTLR
jgi:ubiquinone/menaquinone biosynthesis C-methylase UbiE